MIPFLRKIETLDCNDFSQLLSCAEVTTVLSVSQVVENFGADRAVGTSWEHFCYD